MIRIRGSHQFLRHADGRVTVVPVHGKEAIGPGLLGKILQDAAAQKRGGTAGSSADDSPISGSEPSIPGKIIGLP